MFIHIEKSESHWTFTCVREPLLFCFNAQDSLLTDRRFSSGSQYITQDSLRHRAHPFVHHNYQSNIPERNIDGESTGHWKAAGPVSKLQHDSFFRRFRGMFNSSSLKRLSSASYASSDEDQLPSYQSMPKVAELYDHTSSAVLPVEMSAEVPFAGVPFELSDHCTLSFLPGSGEPRQRADAGPWTSLQALNDGQEPSGSPLYLNTQQRPFALPSMTSDNCTQRYSPVSPQTPGSGIIVNNPNDRRYSAYSDVNSIQGTSMPSNNCSPTTGYVAQIPNYSSYNTSGFFTAANSAMTSSGRMRDAVRRRLRNFNSNATSPRIATNHGYHQSNVLHYHSPSQTDPDWSPTVNDLPVGAQYGTWKTDAVSKNDLLGSAHDAAPYSRPEDDRGYSANPVFGTVIPEAAREDQGANQDPTALYESINCDLCPQVFTGR